mmetsp:Transcript_24715/g.25820  ORF Transcript_24715/g.25820 Transcript_24715/m.25820 type:complete len:692 (-) Transcript_24715:113-2188(-)
MVEKVDSGLFSRLRSMINLVDKLRDIGVEQYIELPKICVLGTQSAGKSSVLESIVGMDFLPRGEGLCTRRPLELRLNHIPESDSKPFGVFEELPGEKFHDFNVIRQKIEHLTDKKAGTNKNIIDDPIILTIKSHTCPDLTVVDLPGITRIKLQNSGQGEDIEKVTKGMAERYCKDPLVIILAVMAANVDITTSEGLKMALEIDKEQRRTLGVLTKVDIMDQGTNAKKTLMGHEVPLKLGYVALKNRSQQDIIDKLQVQDGLKKEKDYFANHSVYKSMPPGYCGTDTLVEKLTVIFFNKIKEHLPEIIKTIKLKIKEAEEELTLLGTPMPVDNVGKMNMLWNMFSDYCESYKNVIKGKYDSKRLAILQDEGGYKIKALFKDLLSDFTGEYRATKDYTDDNISYALTIHEGDSIPGFPSVDAFFYLLKPELEKLRDPIFDCLNDTYNYMEMLSHKIMEKTFFKFPNIIYSVREYILEFLGEQKEKCRYIIESLVDMHINYLFTNDYEYLHNYTTFIPKQQEKERIDSKNIFIREIRNRIEAYFRLILKNLRDEVPKAIGTFLVKGITDNIQLHLYNKIYQGSEIMDALNESDHITKKRISLNETLKVLKQANKEISKNKDLLDIMQINIGEKSGGGNSMISSSISSNTTRPSVQTQPQQVNAPTTNQPATNQPLPKESQQNKGGNAMKNLFGK